MHSCKHVAIYNYTELLHLISKNFFVKTTEIGYLIAAAESATEVANKSLVILTKI